MLLALLRKDLIRRWRSPVSTVVMLLFPFLMTGMIGSISTGSGNSESFPTIKVLLLDRDEGLVGGVLENASGNEEMAKHVLIEKVGEEGFDRMENGDASAMLVIPEGFTDDLLSGKTVQLRFVRNPAESIKPEIVEQGVEVLATYLDMAVKVLGAELVEMKELVEGDGLPSAAVIMALSGRVFERAVVAKDYLFPPAMQMESVKEKGEEDEKSGTVFGYIFVMIAVMSLLFVSSRSILDFFEEQKAGTLRRQLATPLSAHILVLGKVVFSLAFGLLIMGVLLLAGGILGWYAWPINIPLVLLHTLALNLAASGLMVLVFVLTRSEKQAGILSWIVIMLMSVLGGSMFPVENMPESVARFSRLTLNYHGVEGYLDLLIRGRAAMEVWPDTLWLVLFGTITLGVGQALMVRRLQESAR